MNDSEFENFLRGMKPAVPSLSLEGRIAACGGRYRQRIVGTFPGRTFVVPPRVPGDAAPAARRDGRS